MRIKCIACGRDCEGLATARKIADEICDIFDPGEDSDGVYERVVSLVLPAAHSTPAAPLAAAPVYDLLRSRFGIEPLHAAEIAKTIERLARGMPGSESARAPTGDLN